MQRTTLASRRHPPVAWTAVHVRKVEPGERNHVLQFRVQKQQVRQKTLHVKSLNTYRLLPLLLPRLLPRLLRRPLLPITVRQPLPLLLLTITLLLLLLLQVWTRRLPAWTSGTHSTPMTGGSYYDYTTATTLLLPLLSTTLTNAKHSISSGSVVVVVVVVVVAVVVVVVGGR